MPDKANALSRDERAARILAWCQARDIKIACAESLTGGLLADAFVRIPGASRVFLGSAVTYDIAAKASILGVDRSLLEREGAVHPEVARQMARNTARLYTQPAYCGVIGLSTTGVAGPGPDGDKPAGLVYVGVSIPAIAAPSGTDLCAAYELRLHGSREDVRELTVLRLMEIVSQLTVDSQE
ncbi:damage-inducible protein CinA [Bifidobacterium goeldii]|uniref:Damage-inducible protein CinA n=1 Tax=Bifidobacterium goeldii TaxID=2306975 RepID=A0A430FMY4_9BIFI|nr:nicotinamide-nucleotide amidohydrolase family protein [Bifidobacterium goeldii]RSX54188.1 damage-inducible protein CinA [Bifidobacterium goeldii]